MSYYTIFRLFFRYESISENVSNKLGAIYLYPLMGYSFLGMHTGYMLIPDGCGALISLEDNHQKFQQPYTAKIFGEDYAITETAATTQQFNKKISTYVSQQTVTAPVFGMVHTDEKIGFLGIVEDGQESAQIVAYPNGAVTQYNWITGKFL